MHNISDPARVRFTGPSTPYAVGLTAQLAALGYTPTSAAIQLQLAAHLSRWLHGRGLGSADLTGPVLTAFLVDRRRDYSNLYSLQALARRWGICVGSVWPLLRTRLSRWAPVRRS